LLYAKLSAHSGLLTGQGLLFAEVLVVEFFDFGVVLFIGHVAAVEGVVGHGDGFAGFKEALLVLVEL
jgi:hypothetical protein